MIANGLADASDAMRDKDLGEMIDGRKPRPARNNPALFLGGALLLGFAGSRYAKASAERRRAGPWPGPWPIPWRVFGCRDRRFLCRRDRAQTPAHRRRTSTDDPP